MPPRTASNEIIFPGRKIRCVLAHDHVLLRQGLRRLLQDEADMEIIGEASNAAGCLRKVHELQPDVLVADAAIFELGAAEAELLVRRESSRTKIVFLSNRGDHGSPAEGVRAGSGNSTVRHTSAAELTEMVRRSCGGVADQNLASEGVASDDAANLVPALPVPPMPVSSNSAPLSRRFPQRSTPTFTPHERALTAREREVLKLLAEGKTVRATATILGLSSKTVDAHKFNLMRKLGIHNKAELVMWAIQRKVVKIPVNF